MFWCFWFVDLGFNGCGVLIVVGSSKSVIEGVGLLGLGGLLALR